MSWTLVSGLLAEDPVSEISLISPAIVRTLDASISKERTKLEAITEDRLTKNFENILKMPYLRYISSQDYVDKNYGEAFEEYAQRTTRRSIIQIGREAVFGDLIELMQDIPFRTIIKDALSGKEELNTLASPIHRPHTLEENEDFILRKPSFRNSFHFGLRPFRLNPNMYATFSRGSYGAQLTLNREQDIQLSVVKSLSSTMLINVGAELSKFNTGEISYGIGLQKRLGKYSSLRMGASFSRPHMYFALTVRGF